MWDSEDAARQFGDKLCPILQEVGTGPTETYGAHVRLRLTSHGHAALFGEHSRTLAQATRPRAYPTLVFGGGRLRREAGYPASQPLPPSSSLSRRVTPRYQLPGHRTSVSVQDVFIEMFSERQDEARVAATAEEIWATYTPTKLIATSGQGTFPNAEPAGRGASTDSPQSCPFRTGDRRRGPRTSDEFRPRRAST